MYVCKCASVCVHMHKGMYVHCVPVHVCARVQACVCVVTGWGRGISWEPGCYHGSATFFCTIFSISSLPEGCRNPTVQVLFLISKQINWENSLSLLPFLSFPFSPSLPPPFSIFPFFLYPSFSSSFTPFLSSSPNFPPFSIFFLLGIRPLVWFEKAPA